MVPSLERKFGFYYGEYFRREEVVAIYILIKKTVEDELNATFSFETVDGRMGILSLNKADGEVYLIKNLERDDRRAMFERAKRKVLLAFRKGDLPNVKTWAS